jgi:protein-disulfide isomerase
MPKATHPVTYNDAVTDPIPASSELPETPSAPPQPVSASPQAPIQRSRQGSSFSSLMMAMSALAILMAAATWILTSREIDQLRYQVANLESAHRELAAQVIQGGKAAVGQIIDVSKAPARGPDDARVALVEFSDYECPFCIRHFQQTMPLIDQRYIQTGKIRYVFRDFPIDQNHPQAIRAHEASRCALEQNKFWDLHRRLFSAPGSHTPALLEDRAREAGLDEQLFRACIAAGRTTNDIRQTASIADSLGATGTPWFFVGLRDPRTDQVRVTKALGGAQAYEQFALALDAALKDSTSN